MKEFFTDIFKYHHRYNQLLIDQVIMHYEKLPEASYALLCHILNAHQVWNSRILKQSPFGVHAIHAQEDLKAIDYTNYTNTLTIVDTVNMESTITYKTTRGDEFSNTAKDILFHINNHSTYHRAQIATAFRNSGIQPLVSDFIFYKREH